MTVSYSQYSDFALIVLSCFLLSGLTGCDDDHTPYGDGYPGGIVGIWCDGNRDCASGYCCTTKACGNGMCSYSCRTDIDCPNGSLCEAGTCFLACRTDYDCFSGQHCARAHTVCQY